MQPNTISNTSKVIQHIRRSGTVSRADLVRELHLSSPTVLQIVKQLSERSVIVTEGQLDSRGGRRAEIFALNGDYLYAAGIDITRNHLSLVLINLRGELLRHVRLPLRYEDSAAYYAQLRERLEAFIDESGVPGNRIIGAGLSLPGIISRDGGSLTYSHVLQLRDYSLRRFEQACPFPLIAVNDANAAALAERAYLPEGSMCFLSLSNSVGGALFLNGALYMGDHGHSAEFGHMTVVPDGETCYCGKRGCFDAYCSALKLSGPYGGNLAAFFDALRAGEAKAAAIWESYSRYLALMCNQLVMSFDCTVMLGGYVGAYLEPHLDELRYKIGDLNIFEPVGDRICACHYKTEAAAVGAALLPIDRYLMNL